MTRRFFRHRRRALRASLAWEVARKDEAIIASAFKRERGKIPLRPLHGGRTWTSPSSTSTFATTTASIRRSARGRDVHPGAGGEHKRVRGFVPTKTFSRTT